MALIAMCSAKGAPGVSLTALALTLTWSRRVILAECDPGGGDLAAGYLREVAVGARGVAQLGASLHRGRLAEDLWEQLIDLAPGPDTALTRLALPGFADPAQAAGLAPGWQQVADLFTNLGAGPAGFDTIVDCGRLTGVNAALPIVAAADVRILVLRPELPSIRAVAAQLAALRQGGAGPVGLITVGHGPYRPREISIELRLPLVAALPHDPGTATALTSGVPLHRSRLLRMAIHVEGQLRDLAGERRGAPEQLMGVPPAVLAARSGVIGGAGAPEVRHGA